MNKTKLNFKYCYIDVDKTETSTLLYSKEPITDEQYEVFNDHIKAMSKNRLLVVFTDDGRTFGFFSDDIVEIKKIDYVQCYLDAINTFNQSNTIVHTYPQSELQFITYNDHCSINKEAKMLFDNDGVKVYICLYEEIVTINYK